jgi:hypothetical protein
MRMAQLILVSSEKLGPSRGTERPFPFRQCGDRVEVGRRARPFPFHGGHTSVTKLSLDRPSAAMTSCSLGQVKWPPDDSKLGPPL